MRKQNVRPTWMVGLPLTPKNNRRFDRQSSNRVFTIEDKLVGEASKKPTPKYLHDLAMVIRKAEAEMMRQWEHLPDAEKPKIWLWILTEEDRCLLQEVEERSLEDSSSIVEYEQLYSGLDGMGTPDEIMRGAVSAIRVLNHRYKSGRAL